MNTVGLMVSCRSTRRQGVIPIVFVSADGAEHAALEASSCELGEEALDGIEPRRRSRREVERPPRMLHQPFADFGMFVSGIVVDDRMDDLAFGDLPPSTRFRKRMNFWCRWRL